MKNLQTRFLKLMVTAALFFFSHSSHAQSQEIAKADSLFRQKRYTQSLEYYQSVYAGHHYSPAMLLKMAYIQEGLGKIGPTLYYLKQYHEVSDDEESRRKMEELAAKFKLTGYDTNDAIRVQHWIGKKIPVFQLALAAILLLAAFWIKKSRTKPWIAAALVILASASILYLNNFFSTASVIVKDDRTYLMNGPSAGAPVAGILGEGHQLELLGRTDVWLKVKWIDKIVYVKNNVVLE